MPNLYNSFDELRTLNLLICEKKKTSSAFELINAFNNWKTTAFLTNEWQNQQTPFSLCITFTPSRLR